MSLKLHAPAFSYLKILYALVFRSLESARKLVQANMFASPLPKPTAHRTARLKAEQRSSCNTHTRRAQPAARTHHRSLQHLLRGLARASSLPTRTTRLEISE
eukprot:5647651-Prymnesium_polylepis.1